MPLYNFLALPFPYLEDKKYFRKKWKASGLLAGLGTTLTRLSPVLGGRPSLKVTTDDDIQYHLIFCRAVNQLSVRLSVEAPQVSPCLKDNGPVLVFDVLLGQLVDDRGSDTVDLVGDPVCGCFDLRRLTSGWLCSKSSNSYLLSSEEKSLIIRILILFHNSTVICSATTFSLLSVPKGLNHFRAYFPY